MSEVRRRKRSKTERTERNPFGKSCQTGARLGNIQQHLVDYCLLRGSEATMQMSTCRPAKNALDRSSGASSLGLG